MDLRQLENTAGLENENTPTSHLQITKHAERRFNQVQQKRRLNMCERLKKKRQQKSACNMACTENLALVTWSISCTRVFFLSNVVPKKMGFLNETAQRSAQVRGGTRSSPNTRAQANTTQIGMTNRRRSVADKLCAACAVAQ